MAFLCKSPKLNIYICSNIYIWVCVCILQSMRPNVMNKKKKKQRPIIHRKECKDILDIWVETQKFSKSVGKKIKPEIWELQGSSSGINTKKIIDKQPQKTSVLKTKANIFLKNTKKHISFKREKVKLTQLPNKPKDRGIQSPKYWKQININLQLYTHLNYPSKLKKKIYSNKQNKSEKILYKLAHN